MIFELYSIIFIFAILTLIYAFLFKDSNNYTHIISGFLSTLLFFILGYNIYIGVDIDYVVLTSTYTNGSITNLTSGVSSDTYQYGWMGLLFIVVGVIMALYSIVQIIYETGIVISTLERKKDER